MMLDTLNDIKETGGQNVTNVMKDQLLISCYVYINHAKQRYFLTAKGKKALIKLEEALFAKQTVSSDLDIIFDAIRFERGYQKHKWGDEFDSKNTPRAVLMPFNKVSFRENLIKTATL